MALERDDIEERQARIDAMIAEFTAARERRLVKQGIALWTRTEAALNAAPARPETTAPAQPQLTVRAKRVRPMEHL